jgi:ABC-type bacteriocin/lantibiotic exporter with double-glycine peptidase domain
MLELAAVQADLAGGFAGVISDPAAVPESLRHRLILARALITRPGLVLLDEVTNSLPAGVQQRLLSHIRSTGMACLVITHNRAVMAAADRVLLLEQGKISAQGEYAGLLGNDGAFAQFIGN